MTDEILSHISAALSHLNDARRAVGVNNEAAIEQLHRARYEAGQAIHRIEGEAVKEQRNG